MKKVTVPVGGPARARNGGGVGATDFRPNVVEVGRTLATVVVVGSAPITVSGLVLAEEDWKLASPLYVAVMVSVLGLPWVCGVSLA